MSWTKYAVLQDRFSDNRYTQTEVNAILKQRLSEFKATESKSEMKAQESSPLFKMLEKEQVIIFSAKSDTSNGPMDPPALRSQDLASFSDSTVIIPLSLTNNGRNHWVTLHLNYKTDLANIYDSTSGLFRHYDTVHLEKILPKKFERIRYHFLGKQWNDRDCGPHTVRMICNLAENKPVDAYPNISRAERHKDAAAYQAEYQGRRWSDKEKNQQLAPIGFTRKRFWHYSGNKVCLSAFFISAVTTTILGLLVFPPTTGLALLFLASAAVVSFGSTYAASDLYARLRECLFGPKQKDEEGCQADEDEFLLIDSSATTSS